MAIAEVGGGSQRANGSSGGSAQAALTKAFPGNVTNGNFVIAIGAYTSNSIASVTKSAGTATIGAVTLVLSTTISGTGTYFAFAQVTGSGSLTLSVNSSNLSFMTVTVDEFSGIDTATPTDVNGGSTTGTSTSPADGLTTVNNGSIAFGVCTWRSTSTNTPPGGSWTEFGNVENWAVDGNHSAVFQILASAGAQTITWTLGGSPSWAAQTYALKDAGGGGGGGGTRSIGVIVF